MTNRRKSPKRGTPQAVFHELYKIKRKFDAELKRTNKEILEKIDVGAENLAEYKDRINVWLKDHEFKSVNEYLIACMVKDGIIPGCKD